jgi:hypothetical protein
MSAHNSSGTRSSARVAIAADPGRPTPKERNDVLALETSPLLPDLQHDLAAGVPARDPRQRLAGLVERQDRFDLRAEFAGIDQAAQLLELLPAAVGSE